MDTMQNGLTSLEFHPCGSPSLVDDKVFRTLLTAIQNDEKGKLWLSIITYQDYPDPGILLGAESLTKDLAKSEPGKQIDYVKIRKDLAVAEAELNGSHEDKQQISEMCNKLVEGHVSYVQATANALGYELYDKLIDCFYGKAKDEGFEHFIANNIPIDITRSWPPYSKIKQRNNNSIRAWRQYHALAKYNIEQLKSSIGFKVFIAKLRSACEQREEKQRKLARKAMTHLTQRHPQSPQAQATRLALAQRRALIEKRNRMVSAEKMARNERLKRLNLNNIHQLGDQTRICLPDSVIHALGDIQDKYQATLGEDEKKKDDVDEDNIHEVVSQMQIAKHDGPEEPLCGIIIPEGFVHLSPIVGGGD